MPPALIRVTTTALLASTLLIAACGSTNPIDDTRAASTDTGTVALLIDGRPVPRAALFPMLSELGGDRVIEELVLARELDRIARSRSIQITPDDLSRERDDLLASLDADPDQGRGADAIDLLRARRGLGPERYQTLLRSNAILRALTKTRPEHAEALEARTREALALAGSPTIRARLARFADARAARVVRERVVAAPVQARPWVFAELAAERGTGPARADGGLIPELRLNDPALPESVRTRLGTLNPGEVSGVLSTDAGAVLVLVESPPIETTISAQRAREIERRARRVATRERMERLARSILDAADIIVMDRSLGWSRREGSP